MHQMENKKPNEKKKRMILLDCGAHAREWVAPSTCMYLIKEFVRKGSDMRRTLDKYGMLCLY